MRHVIIGGDGFVGRQLASDLLAMDEDVLVADIGITEPSQNGRLERVPLDVTRPGSFETLALKADDMVYNLAAKMLSPLQLRARRHGFFWPVNVHGVENLLAAEVQRITGIEGKAWRAGVQVAGSLKANNSEVLRDALLALGTDVQARQALEWADVNGFAAVDENWYAPIRQMSRSAARYPLPVTRAA